MKKLFLVLIFILLINSVSALNITLDPPKEVNVDEEFEVKLKLLDFPDDVYDVKIDILCGEVRIAKIFDDKWKSTNYYVNDIIRNLEEKEFDLKIEKECKESDVIIKIKNSKNKSEIFSGYKIKCTENEENDEKESENEISENTEEEIKEDKTVVKEKKEIEISYDETEKVAGKNVTENEIIPITLNSKTIKTEDNKEILKKDWALYGIGTFCVVFGALFLFKKRKYKNEFN